MNNLIWLLTGLALSIAGTVVSGPKGWVLLILGVLVVFGVAIAQADSSNKNKSTNR